MKPLCSTMAVLVLSGGLALAQGTGGAGGGGTASGAGTPSGSSTGPTFTPTNPTNGSTLGQSPGVNPSNPQDRTGRNNPNEITKPGGKR